MTLIDTNADRRAKASHVAGSALELPARVIAFMARRREREPAELPPLR
jgi:hypothetical protein